MTDDQLAGLRRHNERINKLISDSLQQSLLLLMPEKPYRAITITELCKKAGVSRMAFYANYATKDELLCQAIAHMTTEIVDEIGSPFRHSTGLDWYRNLFFSVERYVKTLKMLFDAGFKHLYLSVINELVLHDKNISAVQKYYRVIRAGGIVNTLICWLEGGMAETPEQMAEFCFRTLAGWTL